MNFAFKFPDTIKDDKELDEQVYRLKSWICSTTYYDHELAKVTRVLNWYNNTDFKGRYKTNIIVFYERAKVLLTKAIYDKSKGKRFPCPD